jgi:hypothetical protein
MKRIGKKFWGAILGLTLLFAAVGSASAQSFGPRNGYYDRFGYFHPYVYSGARRYGNDRDDRYRRDWDDYYRHQRRDSDDYRRYHRDWSDHRRHDRD